MRQDAANFRIRPIEPGDAPAMHAMRIMPGVQETISSVYSERVSSAEDFIRSLGPDDHHFVAEVFDEADRADKADKDACRVVGSVGLTAYAKPRKRHAALLGIMVRTEWQQKGIGRALMSRALDLADNWLMLARLELVVFASNEHAIRMYESFGFEVEGRLRAASIQNGAYVDDLIMGRLRQPAGM